MIVQQKPLRYGVTVVTTKLHSFVSSAAASIGIGVERTSLRAGVAHAGSSAFHGARSRQLTGTPISVASVQQPGQEGHLLIWQIHFRKVVVKNAATGNDFFDADSHVKCPSVFRQRE